MAAETDPEAGTDPDAEFERLRFAVLQTRLDPHDPEGFLTLGVYLINRGRLEAADRELSMVLAIEPGHADALFLRALIAQHWGQPVTAMRELERLVRRFPNADVLWEPLRAAVDGFLRRTHLYVAALLVLVGLWSGAYAHTPSSLPGVRITAALALVAALAIVVIRLRNAERRMGRRAVRSLVRMRVGEDAVLRTSIILDGIAAIVVLAIIVTPPAAWGVLDTVLVGSLTVATILHAFKPRDKAEESVEI